MSSCGLSDTAFYASTQCIMFFVWVSCEKCVPPYVTFLQIKWSPCNPAIDTEITGRLSSLPLHSEISQVFRLYRECLSLVLNNNLKKEFITSSALWQCCSLISIISFNTIFMVWLIVYMLNVADETSPFTKSH